MWFQFEICILKGRISMPFIEVDVEKDIKEKYEKDPKYKIAFDAIRKEEELKSFAIKYREQQGITQKEIGDLIELTEESVSKIEKMNIQLDLRTFLKYLSAVGLDIKIINKNQ